MIRVTDGLVWEPINQSQTASGTGTQVLDFTPPSGQEWELTFAAFRLSTVGGSTRIEMRIIANSVNNVVALTTAPTTTTWIYLPGPIRLQAGETLRFNNVNAGASATLVAVISGRVYYL